MFVPRLCSHFGLLSGGQMINEDQAQAPTQSAAPAEPQCPGLTLCVHPVPVRVASATRTRSGSLRWPVPWGNVGTASSSPWLRSLLSANGEDGPQRLQAHQEEEVFRIPRSAWAPRCYRRCPVAPGRSTQTGGCRKTLRTLRTEDAAPLLILASWLSPSRGQSGPTIRNKK